MDGQERYRHRQITWWWLVPVSASALLSIILAFTLTAPGAGRITLLAFAAYAVAMGWQFSSLTTIVRQDTVEIRFGPGLFRKCYPLSDFVSVGAVRNEWSSGWGFRIIAGGWVYNIAGLDAVELTRSDGRVTRIGTDEPQALAQALREAMSALNRLSSNR